MELRKDYILDRYVIVSSARGKRPFEFEKKEKVKRGVDFFAPGNEKLTPEEIGRIGTDKKWKIRWFANKFAAVAPEGDPIIRTDNTFFTFSSGFGYHEIIVETPDKDKQLSDLPASHIRDVLSVYAMRVDELSKRDNIHYASVFKNHGKDAGTSLYHSHSQIIAYNKIPSNVLEKIRATDKFDYCPYCAVLHTEKNSHRKCFENDTFVAFTPYASRFHYEIWVMPKDHIKNITEFNQDQLMDLAKMLKKILLKLKKLNVPYNMCLFYSPENENLHFHIEILPRVAIHAGFELLSGDFINSVSPEDAAAYYRGELRITKKTH